MNNTETNNEKSATVTLGLLELQFIRMAIKNADTVAPSHFVALDKINKAITKITK